MKATSKFLVVLAVSLFSAPLFADFYLGGKTGVLDPDVSGLDIDDDSPLALQLGYSFGPLSLQGELYSTENEIDSAGTDAEVDVFGLYGVFRTPGFIYFMAKAGIVNGEAEIPGDDFDETALSYGAGLGLDLGNFIFIEAEYLLYEIEDVEVDFLGVSANIRF